MAVGRINVDFTQPLSWTCQRLLGNFFTFLESVPKTKYLEANHSYKDNLGNHFIFSFSLSRYKNKHSGYNYAVFSRMIGQGGFGSVFEVNGILKRSCSENKMDYLSLENAPPHKHKVLKFQFFKKEKQLEKKQKQKRENEIQREFPKRKTKKIVFIKCSEMDGMGMKSNQIFCSHMIMARFLGEEFEKSIDSLNFTEIERIHIAFNALMALHEIHQKGIVHADIKPENMLLSGTEIEIIDFGLSWRLTDEKQLGCSMLYAPPELLNELCYRACHSGLTSSLHQISEKVDVYSMGRVLLRLFLDACIHQENLLSKAAYLNKKIQEHQGESTLEIALPTFDCKEALIDIFNNLLSNNPQSRSLTEACAGFFIIAYSKAIQMVELMEEDDRRKNWIKKDLINIYEANKNKLIIFEDLPGLMDTIVRMINLMESTFSLSLLQSETVSSSEGSCSSSWSGFFSRSTDTLMNEEEKTLSNSSSLYSFEQ